ncbi:MAG: 50S ribosomal protein L13 [Candidatus Nanoarchaeia archaeon]|nr:50S ribosomal protein L13 [Candidatus Nanoarchaeia archaeon]
MENKQIIINGENAVFGRLCSYAAKQALQGNEIIILNSEKTIITGNKKNVLDKYGQRKTRGGASQKGPNYPREPRMILKRGIRGMLPDYRWGEGREALKRIRCYEGVPSEFKNKETLNLGESNKTKFIKLKEISRLI